MYSGNHWGGGFEIHNGADDDEDSRTLDVDRSALLRQQQQQQLDETQQSWLLGPQEAKKKDKYVDLGCVVVKRKLLLWTLYAALGAFVLIGVPVIIAEHIPKKQAAPPPLDQYAQALHKALLFFNAQKSGYLPKNNGVPWRGNSAVTDGANQTDLHHDLVGGYYDAGDNIKFHFPMAFAMSMLSWSVIEYSAKYKALGEYDHVRELIKWGADYLLLTFNSSSNSIDKIYCQVGTAPANDTIPPPNDHYCWNRPEDMTYPRPVLTCNSAPDLGGEMSAALASASIVFRDNAAYSKKLLHAAGTVYRFARDSSRRTVYSKGNPYIAPFYNSSGYWDEYMWASAWMYYASGNASYVALATNPALPKHANAFLNILDLAVLSWDNKLPAAMLLLTRLRVFLNPGYPYEEMLASYQTTTETTMCMSFQQFNVFNFTPAGLIQWNMGRPQPLQYNMNMAFLAGLYADYLDAVKVPGWYCGPNFVTTNDLRSVALSQVDYVLGKNPRKMSYVVGFGTKYPKQVHHRGASTPHNGVRYSCTAGWKWKYAKSPNPNTITGAMVAGPDRLDGFHDVRPNYNYTEPTMAGNAGLVGALISLTKSGGNGGIDTNTIFSAVPPLFVPAPPPPAPWKP